MVVVKRLLKILVIVAITVPLFLVIGFILAISFMDFNKYKPMIEQEINAKTGLELSIDGDLKAGVWPLQLSIEHSQLKRPGRDRDAEDAELIEPLLRFDQLNLQISYADLLLRGKLNLTGIEWYSPRLVVTRQLDGQLSWQKQAALNADWHYRTVAQLPAQSQVISAMIAPLAKWIEQYDLNLDRFKIIDGELIWRDLIEDQALDITGLQLDAAPVHLTDPMAIKLEAQVTNLKTQQTHALNYQASLRLKEQLNQLELSQLSGSSLISWPATDQRDDWAFNLSLAELNGSLNQGKWQLVDLVLQSEHLAFALDASVQSRPDDSAYQAVLKVDRANLRYWLNQMNVRTPNFIEPQALTGFSGELAMQWANQAWSLDSIDLLIDNTRLNGHLAYRFTEQAPLYQFDLKLDQLNMNFYAAKAIEPIGSRGPRGSTDPVAQEKTQTYLPLAVPVTTLRESKMQGQLVVGQLQAWQIKMQQVTLGVNSNYGQLKLAPFDAQLYGGEWLSQLNVNVNQTTPTYQLKGRINQVDAQDFLQDLARYDQLSGQLTSRFDLRTQGSNLDAIKYHLNGLFSAELNQGAYHSLDINKLLAGQGSEKGDVTQLDQVRLSGEAIDGIYHIQQAELDSMRFNARAFGRVHIPRAQIDSRLQFTYQQPPEVLAKLEGVQIPIRLTGSLRDPQWQVELSQLLSPDNVQRLINIFR